MTHTKSPWFYEYDNDTGPDDDYFEEFFTVYGQGRIEIARVHERDDACLIATAPDLLEALIEANKELEYLNDPKGFVSIRQEKIMEKARAAIAKATGEQS